MDDKQTMQLVIDWANTKLQGNEPPWVWYKLMQLKEAASGLLNGYNHVVFIAEEDGVAHIVRENDIGL